MYPSKILSVLPILNSNPSGVYVELLCSLCDEIDVLDLNLDSNLSWLRQHDFYFVCGRHRRWNSN